jgi:hypothetical protein
MGHHFVEVHGQAVVLVAHVVVIEFQQRVAQVVGRQVQEHVVEQVQRLGGEQGFIGGPPSEASGPGYSFQVRPRQSPRTSGFSLLSLAGVTCPAQSTMATDSTLA